MKAKQKIQILSVLMMVCVLGAIYSFTTYSTASHACLEAGYPEHKTRGWYEHYCIKRVDGTDIVTPLSDVQRRR